MNDKSDHPWVGLSDPQQCMVLHCRDTAEHTWKTQTVWRDWNVEWAVCPAHFKRLQADETWEPVAGQPPAWRRCMLMGEDIGSPTSQSTIGRAAGLAQDSVVEAS